MKFYLKKYYTITGEWVKTLFDFDNESCFVKSLNSCDTDAFLVKKTDLMGYPEYFKSLWNGNIYSHIDHSILIYIRKNPVICFNSMSKDLQISPPFLLKKIESLNKRAFLNYDYNDETGVLKSYLLPRGKKKFVKSFKFKFNKFWIMILFLISLNVLTINEQTGNPYGNNINFERVTYKDMIEKRMGYIESQEFDYDLFVEYLGYLGVRNINVVKSQALLETGFFTSSIFFENNNLFGMKRPYIRKTLVTGVNRGHATYNHWTESVKDYKLWYDFMTRNGGYNNYYDFLYAIGYAEDGEYIQKLKYIEQRIINNEIYLAYEDNN